MMIAALHGPGGSSFFGKIVPETFTFVFGRLPVIFFTLSLVLWGLFIALKNLRERLLSFSIGMTLLTLDLSCLLALKSYGMTGLSREVLFSNGGVLGQFFMQYVFVSVFGTVSVLAPLLILLAVLGLVLVLSFGLRPRHFAFLAKTAKWFLSLFGKKASAGEGEATLDGRDSRESRDRRDMLVDDSTIYSVPDGYNIRDKADIKPFKVRRGLMNTLGGARGESPARGPWPRIRTLPTRRRWLLRDTAAMTTRLLLPAPNLRKRLRLTTAKIRKSCAWNRNCATTSAT